MSRISSVTERRIFELWFDGLQRDQIASTLDISGDTVSEKVALLPEKCKELRELACDLRKSDLSVSEAKEGAELRNELVEISVEPDQVRDFVQSVNKISTNADYEPKKWFKPQ